MSRTEGLLTRLLTSLRSYLGLQREYVMLELTEKLTRLLTVLILGAVLFVIGIIAVVFLGFALVELLRVVIGCGWAACLIVTAVFVLLALLVYVKRRAWLLEPLAGAFTSIMLKEEEGDDNEPQ